MVDRMMVGWWCTRIGGVLTVLYRRQVGRILYSYDYNPLGPTVRSEFRILERSSG